MWKINWQYSLCCELKNYFLQHLYTQIINITMYTVHSNPYHPQNNPHHGKGNDMERLPCIKQKSSRRGSRQWVVDIVGRARKRRSWDLTIGLRGQGCTIRARRLVSIDKYLKLHPSKTVRHGPTDEVLLAWCGERNGSVSISAGLYSICRGAVVVWISGYLRYTVQRGVLKHCNKHENLYLRTQGIPCT